MTVTLDTYFSGIALLKKLDEKSLVLNGLRPLLAKSAREVRQCDTMGEEHSPDAQLAQASGGMLGYHFAAVD